MLVLGGLGAFQLFGIFGALFYILNLGTMQIFHLPFESFSTFFAFLPWGIWSFTQLINFTKKSGVEKHGSYQRAAIFPACRWSRALMGMNSRQAPILTFLIINLLGVPSFYTQQLFVVYFLALSCILLGKIIILPTIVGKIKLIKKSALLFLLILIINAYWIFPQLYFLKTNSGWITQSKANQMATEETIYQNLEKGTLNNFLRLEGFYFDLYGINKNFIFTPWKDHFNNIFGFLPYMFFCIFVIGVYQTIRKKEYGYLLILFFCSIALLSATFPFSFLNQILRTNGFINQIFRSPFTKFIILYSLIYGYFIAQGIGLLLKIINKKKAYLTIYLLIYLLIFLYSLPSFQGYFISPEMKTTYPSDYHQVIEYFKNEDKNKRVALLPDYTFWGWFFNKWGYNGSGFLWYGIEQPIVSRTFDTWNSNSESYFWEIKSSLEAEDSLRLENVLNKYKIDYLLIDYSLIPIISSYKSMSYDRIEEIISSNQNISLIFKGVDLALFKVNRINKATNFIEIKSSLPNIGPEIKLTDNDTAYNDYSNYLTKINTSLDIYYPFLDLTTQTRVFDKSWSIKEDKNNFLIDSKLDINLNEYKIEIPTEYSAQIFSNNDYINYQAKLNTQINDKNLTIKIDKKLINSFEILNENQDQFGFAAPQLPQRYGYLVKIKTKNIKGSPYFFYIIDETKNQTIIEEKLRNETEYFILPPRFDYGLGYSFTFQNKSYEHYPAHNILLELSIYLFPFENLKQTKLINNNYLTYDRRQDNISFEAKKINYFTYKVSIKNDTTQENSLIILNQSYDPGWIAFSNNKILEHIKINNWANGFVMPIVDYQLPITIIFWPQYLEFIGLALLVIVFLRILLIKDKNE